jgi:cyclohexanecarboxyl-CoA dehydrogenase
MRTVATPREGGYRLSGEKTAVSLIPFAEAVIVYARAPGTTGHTGVSAFLVECDWPGVSIGRFTDMGALPLGRGTKCSSQPTTFLVPKGEGLHW